MRFTITVKPNARRREVLVRSAGELAVMVTEPPREGKANEAVIEALALHFGVPRSRVRIVHGGRGRRKVIEIDE